MLRESMIAFAAAAALACGVMAQDANPSGQAQPSGSQMGSAGMTDAISTNPDRAFAAVLISHVRLQRQVSELVAQKATDPQVKQLAQQVVDDQAMFRERIQQAAQKEGITLHPDEMLPRDEAVLSHMKQLPVSRLEREYVFYEAGATRTHQLMCQWAANNAQKPQIKQVAKEIADKLQQRSQTIDQLAQTEVSAGAQPAGERMTPSDR